MDHPNSDGKSDGKHHAGGSGSPGGEPLEFIPPDEWRKKRRRRSRQSGSSDRADRRGAEVGFGARGGSRGNRLHRRGRLTPRQRAERLIVWACCLLLLALAALAGFITGKKSNTATPLSKSADSGEVAQATPASEAMLDDAFAELRDAHPKKALLTFQKIQATQPLLTGIDYLIGHAALVAGEFTIAEEEFQRSLARNEMEDESSLALAVIHLSRSGAETRQGARPSDPLVDAESEFRRFAATHPTDPSVYYQWAEALRAHGSYPTAAALLHKGALRSDPTTSHAVLSAKETLTRLQSEPAKTAPSLSGITSMSAEQAVGAALGCLQLQKQMDALLFLERAREFYSSADFRELIRDSAFDPYRTDPKMRAFFATDQLYDPMLRSR